MKWMSAIALAVALTSTPLETERCAERAADCKEDCLLEFGGSIRVEMRARYQTCLEACGQARRTCVERASEAAKTEGARSSPDAGAAKTESRDAGVGHLGPR